MNLVVNLSVVCNLHTRKIPLIKNNRGDLCEIDVGDYVVHNCRDRISG